MADVQQNLLTVAETARLLQRSTEQVRRYLREGALPGRRLGGQWFVQRQDVERLLLARHTRAVSEHDGVTIDPDPLAAAIAVAGSGGGDIAAGRIPYAKSLPEKA